MRADGEVIPLASWLASLQLPHLVHSPCLDASDELSSSQVRNCILTLTPPRSLQIKGCGSVAAQIEYSRRCRKEDAGGGRETGNQFGVAYPQAGNIKDMHCEV